MIISVQTHNNNNQRVQSPQSHILPFPHYQLRFPNANILFYDYYYYYCYYLLRCSWSLVSGLCNIHWYLFRIFFIHTIYGNWMNFMAKAARIITLKRNDISVFLSKSCYKVNSLAYMKCHLFIEIENLPFIPV